MAKESSQTKDCAAAELLFERSALPTLVPPEWRESTCQDIATTIRWGFADLLRLDGSEPASNRRALARGSGLEIADAAVEVVRTAERRLRASR
ncbi:hypothetical protein ABZX12_41040 [Kribbella sp. NPDC003505]|uniref:hypothetical protein n=1 Tax=Kribbella sp. NPDC003505 TaxID=3154448 RepID=UPI0033AC2808